MEKINEAGHKLMADRIHTLVDQILTVLLSIAYLAANFAMMVREPNIIQIQIFLFPI